MVFAYLFTWHALHVLKGEHQVFAEMREEYLTTGDPEFEAQTRYTTKVGRGAGVPVSSGIGTPLTHH